MFAASTGMPIQRHIRILPSMVEKQNFSHEQDKKINKT